MKNIVAATFQPGYTTAKVLGLWQYDYGQILRIQGLELPDAVEIHFSLQEKGGESERQVGLTRDGVTEVAVPNSYLENAGTSRDYSIYAFLYISDGKSGNTEYKITMYVQSRPEPKDPGTPENPKDDPFGKTIEAVNKAMESTKASAEVAADSAKSASESATQAEKSAVQSREAVEAAAISEKAAATSATAAAESERHAGESATTAQTAADQAAKSATVAAESATTATQQATNAAQSATAAGDSASAAKTSETAAEEAAQTAQEQAEKIVESAEQIEKNKTGVAALEEKKADKTTLAVTERKLDALWKLNQGISYQFEEDSESAYQKEVPTGAKLASVKNIGGKTIVWNQIDEGLQKYMSVYGTISLENDIIKYTVEKVSASNAQRIDIFMKFIVNHIYLFSCYARQNQENENAIISLCIYDGGLKEIIGYGDEHKLSTNMSKHAWIVKSSGTSVTKSDLRYGLYAKSGGSVGDSYEFEKPQIFDLTKMFGSGNEPSTVEEFEAMFPEDYYSYNEGELLSAGVNEIVEHGRNLIDARKVVSKTSDVNFENLGNGKIHVYGSTDTRSEIDLVYVDEKDFPAWTV